jgi:hypothetical protein
MGPLGQEVPHGPGQVVQPERLVQDRAAMGLAHGLGHVIQVQDGKAREEAADDGDNAAKLDREAGP